VSTAYTSYTYSSAADNPLSLTPEQLADVAVALGVTQTPGNINNGSASWTYNVADGKFDFLAVGEVLTLTYTATIDDGHGGVITKPFTITVTGTNDTATIATTSGAFAEMAGTGNAALDHAGGSIGFTDADLSDRPVVSAAYTSYTYDSASHQPLSLTTQQETDLEVALSLTPAGGNINTGSVAWSYDVADNKFDFLAYGEILTLSYTATVDDNHGGVITKPITVTVTGTNDAPVAVADTDVGHIVEAGHLQAGVATATGAVLANDTDVDISDTHHVIGVAKGTATGTLTTGVGATIQGTYGWLVLNDNGTWTYTLDDSNPLTDALAQGVHVSDIFSYTESDYHGGTSTTTLTIDVTGTNDAPVTNAAPVAATDVNSGAPVTEQGANPGNTAFSGVDIASGNVLANDLDVDTGDTKTVQGVASGAQAGPLTGDVASVVAGAYGSVTIHANGTWTYTLDNNKAATQALTQGEHVFDVFTYTMHDAYGATASATLTIDVTGTNDAPTLTAVNEGPLADTAGTDTFPTITGTLVGHDLDDGETLTLHYAAHDAFDSVVATVVGDYGSLTVNDDGTYSYVADAAAINALHEGSYADIFTVQTADANGATGAATFTVDVTGVNDTATISGKLTGNVVEDTAVDSGSLVMFDSGTVTVLDADSDEAHFQDPASLAGTYGTFTFNSNSGAWTYQADPDKVQWLAQDITATDTLTVTSLDGTAQDNIVVTIAGVNDAATITGKLDGNVVEDAAPVDSGSLVMFDSGTVAVLDADSGEAHFQDPASLAGAYGTFTFDSNSGAWTYQADPAKVQWLGQDITTTDTLTVTSLDGTAHEDIVVTITGTNDAPVYSDTYLESTYHAGEAPIAIVGSGVTVSDIDSENYAGGTLTATVIHGSQDGDTLSIVANDHISLVASGTTVMYDADGIGGAEAIEIGTLTNDDYNSLLVTLNADADDAAVAALTEAIKFSNSTGNPAAGTRTVAFTLHDGGGTAHGGHDSDYFEAHVTVPAGAAPVIQTDQFIVSELGDGITEVSGLYVTDTDATETETFTFTASTGASPASSVAPSIDPGDLQDINEALGAGVTYNPGGNPQPQTDSVKFTVTDAFGHSDTVNFIFNQAGEGDVELTGTDGKDVIFATGHTDTLTGGAGADQFVFHVGDGNDTIADFAPGQDHIDLRAFFETINPETIGDWLHDHAAPSQNDPADMVLWLGGDDSITLKHVASLTANDFILHPGGGNNIL